MGKAELFRSMSKVLARGAIAGTVLYGSGFPSRMREGVFPCEVLDLRPTIFMELELPEMKRYLRSIIPHVSFNPNRFVFLELLRQKSFQIIEESYSDLEKCGIVKDKNGAVAKRFPLVWNETFNTYEEFTIPKGRQLRWFGQIKIKKIDSNKKQTWAAVKINTLVDGNLQDVWAFYLIKEQGIEGTTTHISVVDPDKK